MEAGVVTTRRGAHPAIIAAAQCIVKLDPLVGLLHVFELGRIWHYRGDLPLDIS